MLVNARYKPCKEVLADNHHHLLSMSELNLIRLQRIFRELLDDPALALSPEFSTRDHSGWDSVVMVQLVLAVEEEFGVQFAMEDVAEIKSVADLLRLLE